MKPTHCKICGHDHSGPCTECPECRKAGSSGYSKNPPKAGVLDDPVKRARMPKAPDPPVSVPYATAMSLVKLAERVESLEKRLDTIDSRRKYQREYMRKKRCEHRRIERVGKRRFCLDCKTELAEQRVRRDKK